MFLTAKLCKAIAQTIMAHNEPIVANDIVGELLTTACAYGISTIGRDKVLIQLAVQMALVSKHNNDRVQRVIDTMKADVEASKVNPMHGALSGL